MKTVSRDHSYVDYMAQGVGVRVRKDGCRPIIVLRGRWAEYGVPYSIPVGLDLLESQKTGLSSLVSNLSRVEEFAPGNPGQSELRQLITGKLGVEDAVAAA